MKAALIQAPVWGTYDPPLALAQLSSCMGHAGHEVFVFDLNIHLYHQRSELYKNIWAWEQCSFWHTEEKVLNFFKDNQEIISGYVKKVIESDAKIICFSVNSSSKLSSLELARLIKKEINNVLIVFGGNLFYQPNLISSILETGNVDIIARGEGEVTLEELINCLEQGESIACCKGLFFKQNGQIIHTGDRPLLRNLDCLPFLDFESLSLENYDDSEHIALMTSRGCILNCVFCSSRGFWSGFRGMSGERIFREIKYHKEKHRFLGHVNFHDLLFNANIKSLIDFCELMISAKFKDPLLWTANAIVRPEMSPELMKKMKKAGCKHLIYGIESGSQKVLDLMKKRFKITDADKVIKATHAAGIAVTANFMFGFPGETREDFELTLDFIKRNARSLDRVYPSRTYCAIEEFSYLHRHLDEFSISSDLPNHLYWKTINGENSYLERLRRCEEFCKLASRLGIEVGCGVQTSVDLDRWYNLGHYYEFNKDFVLAYDYFRKYYDADPGNVVIANKIKYYSQLLKENHTSPISITGKETAHHK